MHRLSVVEGEAATGILDNPVSAAVPVRLPFRLDYTVAALQRVATNAVEVWTDDGRYLRAFATPDGPVIWEVARDQDRPALRLRLHGSAGAIGPWRSLLRRMLGLDVELGPFYAVAARVPVLAELAERFRGLRPPRFATLWESQAEPLRRRQRVSVIGSLSASAPPGPTGGRSLNIPRSLSHDLVAPGQADHRFRRMPITHSRASRSPIPGHADR